VGCVHDRTDRPEPRANVTCKLGEDLAKQGEILLTASAHDAVGSSEEWQFEDSSAPISGLDLKAYRLMR
jgi:hypothetical protein